MTVSRVSPRYPDTIRSVAEGGHYKFGAHTAGTGNPDDPDIGRVLEAAYSCQIRRTIAAPVTEKSRDFWLPIIHFLLLIFSSPTFLRRSVSKNREALLYLIYHGHNLPRLETSQVKGP